MRVRESRRRGLLVGLRSGWLGFCGLALGASVASAQGVEVIGTRALGMGGAFVAVADDATAVYWNPAGLVRGGLVNLSVERQSYETGPEPALAFEDLAGGSGTLVALGTPPVGASYYRLRTTRLFPATSPVPEITGMATSLVTHNVGGSVAQSIGEYLDVAATVRFVRGVAAAAPRELGSADRDALDRAADLPGHASQTVDVDLGAMLVVGHLRAGLVARNLREPSFETPEPSVSLTLDRQVRAGVAWDVDGGTTMVACDVDLTRTDTSLGPQRHVAIGGERWWANHRLGMRAGLRIDTVDDARPVGSAGVSVRVTPSWYVDGQITHGAASSDRSWGVALRFAY